MKTRATDTITYPTASLGTDSWTGHKSDTRWGWTIGAGAEYALTNNITLRGEYLYVDLGKSRVNGAYVGTFAPLAEDSFAARKDAKFSVVRAGLNWKW